MPLLYAQLIRSSPAEYATAGESLTGLATQIEQVAARLNDHALELSTKARWRGEAQQGARNHNTECGTDLQELLAAVRSSADALAFAAESIQPAATTATATGLEAEAAEFMVTPLGVVMVSPAQYAEANAAGPEAAPELILALEEAALLFTEAIEEAVGEASAADAAAAEAMQAAIAPLRGIRARPLNLPGMPKNPQISWDPSKKHGTVQRGRAAAAPTNPAQVLDNSVPIGPNTTRRVGVDPETGEYCVFDETHPGTGVYHGHVRVWSGGGPGQQPLDQEMRNALIRAGLTDLKGTILG